MTVDIFDLLLIAVFSFGAGALVMDIVSGIKIKEDESEYEIRRHVD